MVMLDFTALLHVPYRCSNRGVVFEYVRNDRRIMALKAMVSSNCFGLCAMKMSVRSDMAIIDNNINWRDVVFFVELNNS